MERIEFLRSFPPYTLSRKVPDTPSRHDRDVKGCAKVELWPRWETLNNAVVFPAIGYGAGAIHGVTVSDAAAHSLQFDS